MIFRSENENVSCNPIDKQINRSKCICRINCMYIYLYIHMKSYMHVCMMYGWMYVCMHIYIYMYGDCGSVRRGNMWQ